MPGLLAPGPFETRGQCALPFVRPFTPRSPRALLRPLLTSRSALRRRPFRREARSPQVRPSAFAARPPDLRRTPLVARASRSLARSPWGTSPCIRFLCVSPRFRSPLLSAPPSRSVALRFAPVPATRSREDFHLPVECHAGHTNGLLLRGPCDAGAPITTTGSGPDGRGRFIGVLPLRRPPLTLDPNPLDCRQRALILKGFGPRRTWRERCASCTSKMTRTTWSS